MAILSILSGAHGPLPLKAQFTAPLDGPCFLMLAGSGWSNTAGVLIGATLELDGVPVGTSVVFSNGTTEHRAFIPSQIPITLTSGAHTIALLPMDGATITDINDFFNVSLIF